MPALVEILLGAGVWAAIVQEVKTLNNFGVVAQSTRLGWLLYGGGVWQLEESRVCAASESQDEEQLANRRDSITTDSNCGTVLLLETSKTKSRERHEQLKGTF